MFKLDSFSFEMHDKTLFFLKIITHLCIIDSSNQFAVDLRFILKIILLIKPRIFTSSLTNSGLLARLENNLLYYSSRDHQTLCITSFTMINQRISTQL